MGFSLKKLLNEAVAQVNPFDHGRTASTVSRNVQPARPPSNNGGGFSFSRAYDQVNPFDNGRTYQQRTPTSNNSVIHQFTHNGLTNTGGSLLNNFTPIPSLIDAARLGTAELTHNQPAIDNATQSLAKNLPRFIPIALAEGVVPFDQSVASTLLSPVAEQKATESAQYAQKVLNNQTSDPIHNAAVDAYAQNVKRDFYDTELHQGGINENDPLSTVTRKIGGQAATAAANIALSGKLPEAVASTKLVPNALTFGGINAASGVAQVAQQDNPMAKDYVKQGVEGAAIGAAIPAAGKVINRAVVGATNLVNHAVENRIPIVSAQEGYIKVPNDSISLPEVPKDVSLKASTKPQTRGTIKTVKSSPSVSPEVQKMIKGTKFVPKPHAPMRAAAEASVSKDLTKATEKAYKDLNQTPGRITDTQQMNAIKVAQAHDELGNHETAANIYSRLATHRTRVAQALAVGQELSKRTPNGIRYAAQKVLEDNKVPFTGKVQAEVEGLMKNVRSSQVGTREREIATQQLVDAVNQHIPRTKIQATVDLWRAGLLTGPETIAKIATSHLITTPAEMVSRPLAAMLDKTVSALPKKALGYLTRNEKGITPGERTVTFNPMDYLNSGARGLGQGSKAALAHLKSSVDEPNTGGFGKELGVGHHQTAYERAVYRVHGSVYKPFYRMAYNIEKVNQTRIAKAKFGGDQAKIDAYLKSDKTQQKMTDYAAQFAMQNQTEAGRITQAIQHVNVGGIPIGQWIAPFSRIPAALGVKGIVDYTPIGTLRAAKTLYNGIRKGTFDQRKFSESLSKSAGTGTALVTAGGLLMANDRMTLQEPTDNKERELWLAEGRTRNSIRIGNRWISMNGMGPVGIALGVGGAFQRSLHGGANGENALVEAVGAGTKLVADQPYMQGISNVTGALQDPAHKAASYINRSVTSFIPAAVQQTSRGTDKSQRAFDPSLTSQVKQAIPGLRSKQPAKHDIFGNVIPGQATESRNGAAGTVNPLYPSKERNKNDAATGELQRLYNVLGAKSAAIQPTTYYTKDNKRINLTIKQQQDMLAGTGPSIHSAISKLIKNPTYQPLDDPTKVSKINDVINAFQNQYIKANINPDQKVTSSQLKYMTTDLTSKNLSKKLGTSSASNLTPLEKYQNALTNYKSNSKSLSSVQQYAAQDNLKKLKVQSPYSADVVSLYGMSKGKTYDYVSTHPDGKKLENQLIAYDKALYDAGLTKYRKYSNGVAPAAKGTKSGRTRSSGRRKSSGSKYKQYSLSPLTHKTVSIDKSLRSLINQAVIKSPSKPKLVKLPTNKRYSVKKTTIKKSRVV